MLTLADERQRRLVLDSLWLGLVGALAAQVFLFLLDLSQRIFLEGLAGYTPPGLPNEGGSLVEKIGSHGLWLLPLVTTLGGLLVGLLIHTLAPEAEGEGTDSAVKAFHHAGGRLRAHIPPLKMIASAITLGSGGSAGREGPTALITAGIGSVYGSLRQRSDDERRMLMLIGMAAGLSAIFRTPIGAAIFAIEVLYYEMEFESSALLYTILASVVAYTINGIFVGWKPLFAVPPNLAVNHAEEYLEYAVLGIAGGILAALMPVIFYRSRDTFRALQVPAYLKPAIGGLLVGLIGLALPEAIGGGYGWMQMAIDGRLGFKLLLLLPLAKMITLALTVGSGGSGGVFAPSLFVGAMLGGALAEAFGQDSPAAFVVVGMAAVFSGAGHIPIAALFMVSELTGGYRLLPAAALVVALSYLVQVTLAQQLKYKSLYEGQLPTRPRRDVDLLEGISVAEAMETTIDSVPPTMPLPQLLQEFERTHHHGFTVVDDGGNLCGIVSLDDLEQAMLSPDFEQKTVADIAIADGIAVGYPDETVSEALWRMGVRRIGRLPIVDRANPRRLVGILRRQNIIEAYERAIANRKDISARLRELREAHEGNVRVVEVDIGDRHRFIGKQVKDIARELPDDCILVSIRRDKRVIIPHGTTEIRKGDHLVTLASAECAEHVRAALK